LISVTDRPAGSPNTAPRPALWLVFFAVLAVKLLLLAVDPHVRLFMGDSASYLFSAETDWVPPDRSYIYALVIRACAVWTHSLFGIALLQSVFGAAVAVAVFHLLQREFALGWRGAALFALIFAVGPEQLFFERMLMAESAGLFAFAGMLLCAFAYLHRRRWPWLCASAVCGIAAVSLRMSLLPIVFGLTFLPIAIAAVLPRPAEPAGRRLLICAGHLLIALAATSVLHASYKSWHAGLNHSDRGDYIAYGGYFRLGLVAPLVKPEHLHGLGLPDDLLSRDAYALSDPRNRETQMWGKNGLVDLLRSAAGDGPGNLLAGKIASRALRSDPLGLVRLSYATTLDYFDPHEVDFRMTDDLGARQPDAAVLDKLRDVYHYDYRTIGPTATPVYRWFRSSATWLIVCLFALAPLGLATIIAGWRQARGAALLLGLTSIGLVAGHLLFSHIVSFRYLHAFPFFVLLNVGALVSLLTQRTTALRQRGAGPSR
jgi:hypothetical protein